MISTENPVLAAGLRVVATAYGGAVRLRNRYYDRSGAPRRASVPVISVGNLTVGGTGKTPMVGWLAEQLRSMGRRPAVVSRGYRGRAGRGPVVVCSGNGPTCMPADCGDEPYLLARNHPEVTVVVGSDRVAGAAAAARAGCDVVVLDDGFQHRRLARDLDIVLLDASNPFGSYRVLPAGLLREPVAGIHRADVVVITRSRPDESLRVIEHVVRHHNPTAPIVRAGHRPLGIVDDRGHAAPVPRRAIAFCGIGNPSRFRIDLEAEGVDVVVFEVHRDHHPYRPHDLARLYALAAAHDAGLITTEKDLVRLDPAAPRAGSPPVLALRIETVVYQPEPLLQAVSAALGGR
jgi:tetraacyldisaccharide 4'-kinase